jgi:hypothetical protein
MPVVELKHNCAKRTSADNGLIERIRIEKHKVGMYAKTSDRVSGVNSI